jgi:NAD-dependent deacetylase
MQVASATAFRHHPQRFYDWLRPLLLTSQQAIPNPAHKALAEMENSGILNSVITQNIDGLHQRAGSKSVIELHGSMQRFYCPVCNENSVNPDDAIATILAESIPKCKQCGSIIRPDITLFEETLPVDSWQQAEREISNADVLLVAGSSLEVIPASSLPYEAYRNGCRIIIVNLSSTYLDLHADVVIHADVAAGIPQIVQELKNLL